MRRKSKQKVDEKSQKQEIKTEFTQNSQDDGQISLDINKDSEQKKEDSSQASEQKLSSQSSEYEEKKARRSNGKRKKSLKRTKRQAFKLKKSLNKKSNGQNKLSPKLLSIDNSQIISRKYSSLFFSEQSLTDHIQKDVNISKRLKKSKNSKERSNQKQKRNHKSNEKTQDKVSFWEKVKNPPKQSKKEENNKVDIKQFVMKNGQLHITDYEVFNEQQETENYEDQIQTTKILYTFEPKYETQKSSENQHLKKVTLTSNQVAESHELFAELIRFYRNMWDDHVNIGGIFV